MKRVRERVKESQGGVGRRESEVMAKRRRRREESRGKGRIKAASCSR